MLGGAPVGAVPSGAVGRGGCPLPRGRRCLVMPLSDVPPCDGRCRRPPILGDARHVTLGEQIANQMAGSAQAMRRLPRESALSGEEGSGMVTSDAAHGARPARRGAARPHHDLPRCLLGLSLAAAMLTVTAPIAAAPEQASTAPAGPSPAQVLDPGPLLLTLTGDGATTASLLTCTTATGRVLSGAAEVERALPVPGSLDCSAALATLGTETSLRGTVASAVGRSDAGRITALCDGDRIIRATWRQTGTGSGLRVNGLTWTVAGYRACDWTISFDDGSRLVGALEDVPAVEVVTVGEVATGRARLSALTALPVTITGGEGRYRSVIGTALLLEVEEVTVAFPGGTAAGETLTRLRPTTPAGSADTPPLTPAAPTSAGRRSVLTDLRLLRSAGGLRIVSPAAQQVGQQYGVRPLGFGPDGLAQTVRIATAPGATCSVAARSRRPQARYVPLATSVVGSGRWATGLTATDVITATGAPADGGVDIKVDCTLADSSSVSSEIRASLGQAPIRPL